MSDDFGNVTTDIDDGPITEGPPKTIPELWDRLIASEIARDAARDAAQAKLAAQLAADLNQWKEGELAWKTAHDEQALERHKIVFDTLNIHNKRLDAHDAAISHNTRFGGGAAMWAIVLVISLAILVNVWMMGHPTIRYVLPVATSAGP